MVRLHPVVCACLLVSTFATVAPAGAVDLRIGRSNEPSSIDPQFSRTGNNLMTAQDLFDRLVENDANLQTKPGLAVSWKTINPTAWEVRLRENVKFHDGSPLTADDVLYSLKRAGEIKNSPAPFSGAVGGIASMKAVDAHTLRFETKTPNPEFIEQIGRVYIVSKKATEGKQSADFSNPAVAIGTGPYKFKQWVPGDRLVMTRNDAYWGRKPAFDTVMVRFMTNDAARVAALRSGTVDLIDSVPPADIKALKSMGGVHLFSTPSARIIYLALDFSRDPTPFVVGANGQPLSPNPLRNPMVRLALSKLITASSSSIASSTAPRPLPGSWFPRASSGTRPTSSPNPTILRARKRSSPRPATRTASASRSTRPTTASTATRTSRRRSARCSRGADSR